MKFTRLIVSLALFSFLAPSLSAQLESSKKILFIGNSYTGVNNLPQLVYDVALSVGDTVVFDKHTPGGTRLINHASNANAMAKINSNNWDYVVLQAQSQEPSWPIGQVETEVFPYATILCDSIRANDPCSRPLFYMTWGRENGDASNCASWPPVCTYVGMDSLLNLRYRMMGDDNEAYVSPVGAVWHYLRENHPEIDLYSGDGSHPSLAGSYAAACTFYAITFQKDPTLISFISSLAEADANTIKAAAKVIAYDDLSEWNVGAFDPVADFSLTQNDTEVTFANNSTYADEFQWNFGDGNTSTERNPVHSFQNNNTYSVQLIVSQCGIADTTTAEVSIQVVSTSNLSQSSVQIFPNPTEDSLSITGIPKDAILTIVDGAGKEWQRIKSPNDHLRFDLSLLNRGVYFVKIQLQNGDLFFVKKVVKR